jgi:hypothetical protein
MTDDMYEFAFIFNQSNLLKRALANATFGLAMQNVTKETFYVPDNGGEIIKSDKSTVSIGKKGYLISKTPNKNTFDADLVYEEYANHIYFVHGAYLASKMIVFKGIDSINGLKGELRRQNGKHRSGLEQMKIYKRYLKPLVVDEFAKTKSASLNTVRTKQNGTIKQTELTLVFFSF